MVSGGHIESGNNIIFISPERNKGLTLKEYNVTLQKVLILLFHIATFAYFSLLLGRVLLLGTVSRVSSFLYLKNESFHQPKKHKIVIIYFSNL